MRRVPLARLLTRDVHGVAVNPMARYPSVGILNRGRGLFRKPEVLGADTSYRTLHPLKASQVVYSKLFAWEGSVALVDDDSAGSFVSSEFPHFDVDKTVIEPGYLRHALAADFFTDALSRATTGMGQRRQRVNVDSFLKLVIPLPSIDEQRDIAARLDSLAGTAATLSSAEEKAHRLGATIRDQAFAADGVWMQIAEVVRPVRREEPVIADRSYCTAGVRWYGEGLFHRATLPGSEIRAKVVFHVDPGDLVYNRLFAWKGSFALVADGQSGLVVSNEFPVFTVDRRRIMPEYLQGWLSLPSTWGDAARLSSGGTPTSRNRLKEEQFVTMRLPVPDLRQQQSAAALLRRMLELKSQIQVRRMLAAALPQAARNEVFSKLV